MKNIYDNISTIHTNPQNIYFQKSLVVLSFCLTVVMGTQYHSRLNMRFPPKAGVSTHFGYSLPSGYASTSYHFRPLSIDAINKFALSKVAQKNKKAFIKPLLSVGRNFHKNSYAIRKYHKYYNHQIKLQKWHAPKHPR